ncbi:MAG: chemotaxis protein CheW [Hahellaceae bacterium]|jgi:chemosensory pili system protein ChpC|nr:chemotaxis protein CheW [Hahellaceae bacterium]
MATQPNSVSCLLIPVQSGRQLLVPNTCIAEIVDYQTPEQSNSPTPWFLGFIRWRGLRLPLISYEAANESATPGLSRNARIAVTNSVGPNARSVPFIAFLTTGLPRLAKVFKEELVEATDIETGKADAMAVTINGESAIIPRFETMEALAKQALSDY